MNSCEYINDFMYFIVRQEGSAAYIYCSGVNITRFTPLTAGKHRLGQNIVMKGLQSSNIELRSYILLRGWQPRTLRGGSCHDEQVRSSDDLWNAETLMIENTSDDFSAEDVVNYSVKNFLRIVLPQCLPPGEIPEALLNAEGLQTWLNSHCKT
ncbi:hypothetical protein [Candidatus Magnetominusculus xianensis]|uniref:Uncharacterized protein n=1 Tax=Candidatus Magnetominusculus xianensis TaxID=1748249 RepID=A0ABR5SB10_9BACT|nr:hypothetical protein [Candidatus Magnetominusculus xianensis]KWT75021.1 hypothetical protein ASN18_3271 [Candidatus Magnetominusculus xianensis]MBF0405629.1 hypothetical protein [Nitrospirota bacterium]